MAHREWAEQRKGWLLWFLIRDRLLFCEYFGDRLTDSPTGFKPWYTQKMALMDNVALERNGRDTGKSKRVVLIVVQSATRLAVEHPNTSVGLASPDEVHTMPIYEAVLSAFRKDSFFRALLPGSVRAQSNLKARTIWLRNLDCRIRFLVGGPPSRGGFALQGPHVDALVVDEIGAWDWTHDKAMLSSVNMQMCIGMHYFGVVLDDDTSKPVWDYTEKQDQYSRFKGCVYHIPQLHNIYTWNLEMHRQQLQALGGFQDDEFRRQIMGQVGTPTLQEYSREEWNNVRIGRLGKDGEDQYRVIRIGRQMAEAVVAHSKLALFDAGLLSAEVPGMKTIGGDSKRCMFSMDYGPVAPSQLLVMVFDVDADVWRLCLRVEMRRVPPQLQAAICHDLVSQYYPWKFAMDCTSQHNPLYALLTNEHDERFRQIDYKSMLFRADFTGTIPVASYDEPMKDVKTVREVVGNGECVYVERARTKQWAVRELHQWFEERRMEIPDDPEIENSVLGLKRKKVGWTQGDDHNLAALWTFVIGHHMCYVWNDPVEAAAARRQRSVAARPLALNIGRALWKAQRRQAVLAPTNLMGILSTVREVEAH